MNGMKILRAIGGVDDALIERAALKNKKTAWKWVIPAAACLILTVVIVFSQFIGNKITGNGFDLVLSDGVQVSIANNPPNIRSESLLIYLTEEELFADWHGMERVIFEGVITKVNNIVITFGNEWHKNYRAIAYIEVTEVFRGNIEIGTTVSVLLPAPVGQSNIWVEDTSVSSQMTAGTTGIFLPVRYDESALWGQNDSVLYLQEIADYGLLDGERHAFLEKQNGLVFARDAYTSVENATTMDEIRQYVISMLER